MKNRKLLTTLASSVMLAGGILAIGSIGDGNLNEPQTVQAARHYKRLRLTHNAAVYNSRGHRVGRKVYRKSKRIKIYGTKRIRHKLYYRIGHGRYLKASNFKAIKPKRKAKRIKKAKTIKPSTPGKKHNSAPVDTHDNSDDDTKVETPDAAKVQQLLWDKIQAARQKEPLSKADDTYWASQGFSGPFYCMPWKTNNELQDLANMRVEEATKVFAHTRPDGTPMDANEYQKLIPKTAEVSHVFGETLSGTFAHNTNEETAEFLFHQLYADPAHHDIIMDATDPGGGYAAVAVHYDEKGGFCACFEMAGSAFNGTWYRQYLKQNN